MGKPKKNQTNRILFSKSVSKTRKKMYCIKYSTHPKTTHITHNLLTSKKKKDICIHTIQIQMMMIFVRFYEKKEIKARRISKKKKGGSPKKKKKKKKKKK